MTLEQALSRQGDAVVLEADDQSYRKVFSQMLASMQGISDRVERSDLGVAYAGLDGLEDMYGGEARLVNSLLNSAPQDLAPRVEWPTPSSLPSLRPCPVRLLERPGFPPTPLPSLRPTPSTSFSSTPR